MTAPVSCCLSATGIRFLGVLFPLGIGLPHGRPTGPPATVGPDRNGVSTFHTHETRPDRVPPTTPGRRCSHDRHRIIGRRLPLPNGQSCTPVPHSTFRGST